MPTVKEILYGDVGYEGASADPSIFSVDYYRNKVREFQDSLNRVAAQAESFAAISPLSVDADSYDRIAAWLDDYWAKRTWILEAAEGVNLLAEGANAVGIRFPVLAIPTNLQALPPVLALAGIAALTAIVAVVEWSAVKQADAANIAAQIKVVEGLPPEERAAATTAIANVQRIAEQGSISATIANSVKWIVLGVGAVIALKMFADR